MKAEATSQAKEENEFFTLGNVAKIIAASEGEDRVLYWLVAETGLRAGELAGLRLTDIDGERLTVNQSVRSARNRRQDEQLYPVPGLVPQLVALLWEQIARQIAKGHG